jgi:hypothetical protein
MRAFYDTTNYIKEGRSREGDDGDTEKVYGNVHRRKV